MPAINKLNYAKLKAVPVGKHGDGGGLWFHKRPDGGAQWILRFTLKGHRHEMGLGGYPEISLKEARSLAEKSRALVRSGVSPIKEREQQRRAFRKNQHTLSDVAVDAFEAKKADLKEDGKAGRWFSPLENHILPKLGRKPIVEIDQDDICKTLEPIWHTKADTARKAINRLSIVFRHARARKINVDIHAVQHAKDILGKQRHTPTHTPALHWSEVPKFYASLDQGSTTHLALRLLILTAVRSKPLRFMRLDHVVGNTWTIPAELMKGPRGKTRDFRVPLSDEALRVLDAVRPLSRGGFVFPSVRKGVISDATMARHMERRQMNERPHGFRSSFRDWLAETQPVGYEVGEACLSHMVGRAVERSYKRTDYLDQRRVVMDDWAQHVCSARFAP